MQLKSAVLFLVLALAATGDAQGCASRTIASATDLIRALRESPYERREYCLTGTVTAVESQDFILSDDSGRFNFLRLKDHPVAPGDVVSVHGTLGGRNSVWKPVPIHAVSRIGTTNPPPPTATDIAALKKGRHPLRLVAVEGTVKSVFRDDIDATNTQLYLWEDGESLLVSLPTPSFPLERLIRCQGARVRITGICYPYRPGKRMFRGLFLRARDADDLVVLTSPPADPFDFPVLRDIHREVPEAILSLGRQRTSGHVLAAWHGGRFLLRATDGQMVGVSLADGETPPRAGEAVDVVGDPETDLFRINLSGARVRHCASLTNVVPAVCETETNPSALFLDAAGHPTFQAEHHGQTLLLKGVIQSLPAPDNAHGHMTLSCGRFPVMVDTGACPDAIADLKVGCRVAVVGTGVFDCTNWRPATPFPRITGFMLVVRTPEDVRLLARAPWWTPGRLLAIICSLVAALLGFLVWNRLLNRLVTRRSHELVRERLAHAAAAMKVGERTRLAVELHDALSQNLAGVACQLAVAKDAVADGPEAAVAQLETAERMLQSSRTELKRCLWDLRGNALEERDLSKAVSRTLAPLAGNIRLDIGLDVPRSRLDDSTVHAFLCIVRELVSNAIRHGQATAVRIDGEIRTGELRCSVSDNGSGFAPADAPSVLQGHFGLVGIRERLNRMGGAFELTSAPRNGTTATVTIPVPSGPRTKGFAP